MTSLLWKVFRGRSRRWFFNLFPAFAGTGGRVTFISDDFRELRVALPLNWLTRNYVGTIFGGSLYGCVDPFYMMMLIQILGPDYVVWDKAAVIRFLRPGRSTLFARFLVPGEETDAIRKILETEPSVDRVYRIDLADAAGTVHATVEKTIYVRRRDRKPRTEPRGP
jgi:acyl-coenzyme A thioesterase PaaI-like protein